MELSLTLCNQRLKHLYTWSNNSECRLLSKGKHLGRMQSQHSGMSTVTLLTMVTFPSIWDQLKPIWIIRRNGCFPWKLIIWLCIHSKGKFYIIKSKQIPGMRKRLPRKLAKFLIYIVRLQGTPGGSLKEVGLTVTPSPTPPQCNRLYLYLLNPSYKNTCNIQM